MHAVAVLIDLCRIDLRNLAGLHLLVKLAHDQVHAFDFGALDDHFRVRHNYWLRVLNLKLEPWLQNLLLTLNLVEPAPGRVPPRSFVERLLRLSEELLRVGLELV